MKRKSSKGASRLELQQGMSFIESPFIAKPDSRKRCQGCQLRSVEQWCQYRRWKRESSKGYHFRLYNEFQKKRMSQNLPICKHPEMSKKTVYVPKPTIWDKIKSTEL